MASGAVVTNDNRISPSLSLLRLALALSGALAFLPFQVLAADGQVLGAPFLNFQADFVHDWGYLTPPPEYPRAPRFSISPEATILPVSRQSNVPPFVSGSDFYANTITLQRAWYKNLRFTIPQTYDAGELLSWRNKKETRYLFHSGRSKLKETENARGKGVKISIPLNVGAVESVFGEGGAGLQVSGYRRISFAGNSNWTDGSASRYKQSKFPTLQMDQSYSFDIMGTIGSKIFVKVNQNSQVDVPLANRLEIRFKGSEDDVIKSIEAGNTTLGLGNTSLLNYSSSVKGLFGIKTVAQMGPIRFTGIASQEKASSERQTYDARGRTDSITTRERDYARFRILDLGTSSHFSEPGDEVVRINLYREFTPTITDQGINARMMLVPPNTGGIPVDSSEGLTAQTVVKEVPSTDYEFDFIQRTITFKNSGGSYRSSALGVLLTMKRGNGSTYDIGLEEQLGNTMVLKMIKCQNDADPKYPIITSYEWKNVYEFPTSMGLSGEDPDFTNIKVQILKGDPGTERIANGSNTENQGSTPYIEILGLDQFGSSSPVPDGVVDFYSPLIVDGRNRLLIFPSRRPFDTDTTYGNDPTPILAPPLPQIYDDPVSAQKDEASTKYYILFTSTSRSNTIQLSGSNIIEGSEVVTSNGQRLNRGTDYTISGGVIQLISEQATNLSARVQVEYESAPLFSVEKKTLLGSRLEYDGGPDFNMGTTVLYKSDKATTRKPKVGQETSKMFALDSDIGVKFRPNFLTTAFDKIPGVRAQGPSSVALSAEVARSFPNPNTDGEAFIDDFEGSREEQSIGLLREQWYRTARPAGVDAALSTRAGFYFYNPLGGVNRENVYNQETTVGAGVIFPLDMVFQPRITDLDTIVTTSADTSRFCYQITVDSSFCSDSALTGLSADSAVFTATTDSSVIVGPPKQIRNSWDGVVYPFKNRFGSPPRDFSQTEFVEIRMRVTFDTTQPFSDPGNLHVDFGQFTEDIYPNGALNSEDRNSSRYYDNGEDMGLDGRSDDQERIWYKKALDSQIVVPGVKWIDPDDPEGDNSPFKEGEDPPATPWAFDSAGHNFLGINDPRLATLQTLRKINGTQSNEFDYDRTSYGPDNEDINNPSRLSIDLDNDYYSFKVDLDTRDTSRQFFVQGSGFPLDAPGRPALKWFTYRIPIHDTLLRDTLVGVPSWKSINAMRLWFDSASDTVGIEIASINLVRNNWIDTVIRSALVTPTAFKVAVINTEENSGVYTPPPGVTGSYDQVSDIREAEQSLLLEYGNLVAGDTGLAQKRQGSIDYTGYRLLKMYVHGDENLSDPTKNLSFFFRIGTDSLNFYEYRTRLVPGWDPANEVVMDFNELTALKDKGLNDSSFFDSLGVMRITSTDGKYFVRGRPSLRVSLYFAAGVSNGDTTDSLLGINGSVWINELRLADVRSDPGTAGRASFQMSIGDFISNFHAEVRYSDPFYRGVSAATRGGGQNSLGSGASQLDYSFGLSVNGSKLFPPSLGLTLPLSANYGKTTTTPLLVTANNSDIRLTPERRIEERSVSVSRSVSLSESFNKNTKNPLFTVLLNKFRSSFSYSQLRAYSPTNPATFSQNQNVTASYDAPVPRFDGVPLFGYLSKLPILKKISKTKFNPFPVSMSANTAFSRQSSSQQLAATGRTINSYSRTLNSGVRGNARLLSGLNSNATLDVQSDLTDPRTVNLSPGALRLGKERQYRQNFSSDYSPSVFPWLTHRFNFTSTYNEQRRQRVTADTSGNDPEPRDVSQSLKYAVSGTFDFKRLLNMRGGGAGGARARGSMNRAEAAERARKIRETAKAADTTKPDSGAVAKVPDKPEDTLHGPWLGARFYNLGRRSIAKVINAFDPISGSIERNKASSQNGLLDRPGAAYRFGFSDEPDVEVIRLTRGQRNDFSVGTNWRLGSGFSALGGGITIKTDLAESRSSTYPTSGAGTTNIQRTWPNLSITISEFRGLEGYWGIRDASKYLNKFIRAFRPQTAYSRRTSATVEHSTSVTTSRRVDIERRPFLAITVPIPVRKDLTISVRWDKSSGERESRQSGNGRLTGASRESSSQKRIGTGYSFRAPKGIRLPIFGRIRIQSTLVARVDVSMGSSKTETARSDGTYTIGDLRNSFSVANSFTYTFSNQVKGGLTTTWTDTNSPLQKRKTHLREVRFYAEMSF